MLTQIRRWGNTRGVECNCFYMEAIEHLQGHNVNRQDVLEKLY